MLKWTGNWTTFIDNVFQIGILRQKGLRLPVRFTKIVIDPVLQSERIVNLDENLQGKKLCKQIPHTIF